MTQREYYAEVISRFERQLPDANTELQFTNNFELLVAVMLSAQCTDKRINTVTPALFHAFPNAEAMSKADEFEILEYIKSVSYPNSKARHLVQMSRQLVDRFSGEVPSDFNDLVTLPGVGRKTANVITSHAFGRACIAVDTHVFCVSHRVGLVPPSCTTPLATEKFLTKHVPAEKQLMFHFWLLEHGKHTCKLRNPNCQACFLSDICKKRSV